MSYHNRARVVTHGGLLSALMDSSSCAGGNVISFDDHLTSAFNLSFPVSSAMSFTFHEMYLGNESVPREFQKYPPDYNIYYWGLVLDHDDPFATAVVMSAAASLFPEVPSGLPSVLRYRSDASVLSAQFLFVPFAILLHFLVNFRSLGL
eukprot:TRINITY_DN9787_c0_g1_i1.p1 TRINITY_DN9787_c0_g1~~TRINITY_DN9787_c0_g1_i1.p1  ORF type:complete len:172 (+),score=13.44 TRINITY_DN9787_c0_g1_i1:71-517(+)